MSLGREVGLDPGDIVLDRDPWRKQSPIFRPMSIVAKRSPISTTAELLYIKRSMRHLSNGMWKSIYFTIDGFPHSILMVAREYCTHFLLYILR